MISIDSDGTVTGTRVFEEDTGRDISQFIKRIEIVFDAEADQVVTNIKLTEMGHLKLKNGEIGTVNM